MTASSGLVGVIDWSTQVGGLHDRILRYLIRSAHGNDLALVEHVYPIADTGDEIQVVIDDDNTGSDEFRQFSDPVNHLRRFAISHTTRRLIEKKKPGRRRCSSGKLEAPSISIVEFSSSTVAKLPQPADTKQEFDVRLRAVSKVTCHC